MRYNLAYKDQERDAMTYFMKLIEQKADIQLAKVQPRRSLNQNNYLHLLLAAFGMHFGYTLEEAKAIYKEINASTYKYEKKGRTFVRSSADLDSKEMTKTIDKFRAKSAEHGCELPTADNTEYLRAIENDIERNKYV